MVEKHTKGKGVDRDLVISISHPLSKSVKQKYFHIEHEDLYEAWYAAFALHHCAV